MNPTSALVATVLTQKGGVGKTTLVLLLADALRRRGLRVLLGDLDPQGNLTGTIAPDTFDPESDLTLYDAYDSQKPGAAGDAIISSNWEGVDLLPGDLQLANYDANRGRGTEQMLKRAMADVDGYDVTLFDCPRSLGPLTDGALVYAQKYLTVSDPTRDGLNGVGMALQTAATIRELYNPELADLGTVMNLLDRYVEHEHRLGEIERHLGNKLWSPPLPKLACINRVREHGTSLYDDKSSYAQKVVNIVDLYADRLLQKEIAA